MIFGIFAACNYSAILQIFLKFCKFHIKRWLLSHPASTLNIKIKDTHWQVDVNRPKVKAASRTIMFNMQYLELVKTGLCGWINLSIIC